MKKPSRAEWGALLDRYIAGDQDAATAIYHSYKPLVSGTIARYCQPDDREDVEQVAWIRIFLKLETFNRSADLGTWIFRVATNAALMQYRQRFSYGKGNEVSLDQEYETAVSVAVEDKSVTLAPELLALRKAIEELTPLRRQVIGLKLRGYSIKEIMKFLDRSSPAVKSIAHRAIEQLQEIMT